MCQALGYSSKGKYDKCYIYPQRDHCVEWETDNYNKGWKTRGEIPKLVFWVGGY